MKKILFSLFLTLMMPTGIFAQSMTDDAVMAYVKDGVKQGKTQKQLYQELLIKGATKEQLLRIKEKYEQQQSMSKERQGNANIDTERTQAKDEENSPPTQHDHKQLTITQDRINA